MDNNKALVQAIVDRMKIVIGVQKDKELADYLGGSKSGPAVWKLRGSIPISECIALAEEKKVSLDWLILGRGTYTTEVTNTNNSDLPKSFYIELPVFEMGTVLIRDDVDAGHIAWRVPRSFMEEHSLSCTDTIVVRAVGASMAGVISDGQYVIVDRRKRDSDGVYLVRLGESLRIARLQRMVDGATRLSYQHPAYAVDEVRPGQEDKMEIIGYCHSIVARIV